MNLEKLKKKQLIQSIKDYNKKQCITKYSKLKKKELKLFYVKKFNVPKDIKLTRKYMIDDIKKNRKKNCIKNYSKLKKAELIKQIKKYKIEDFIEDKKDKKKEYKMKKKDEKQSNIIIKEHKKKQKQKEIIPIKKQMIIKKKNFNISENMLKKTVKIIKKTPQKEQAKKIKEIAHDLSNCSGKINAILDKIYNGQYLKTESIFNSKEFWEEIKNDKELYSDIISGDFFPTPPKYGKIIYNIVSRDYNNDVIEITDIGSGLGSLVLPFIYNEKKLKIKKINLIEISKQFVKILRCFEVNKKINVINKDFLKLDLNEIIKMKNNIMLMNPPFNKKIGRKILKKNYYLWFIYKALHFMYENDKSTLFFICPNRFFISGRKYLTELEEEDNILVSLKAPTSILKKIEKDLNISIIGNDELEMPECLYIGRVSGFKGLTKTLKPHNSPDSFLFAYGSSIYR